jgi:GNAT superfamily N-acetyltransferase
MTDTLAPTDDRPLATGWDPTTGGADTLERASVLATAERAAHVSTAMGQPVTRTDAFVAADTGLPAPLTNWAVLQRPIIDPDDPVVDEIARCYPPGRPHVIVGPWPTPDLAHRGLLPVGHPPFMLRPIGPATTIPGVDGFVVTEAVDGPSLEVVERVLIDGYPIPELSPVEPGRCFDERVLGGPIRFYLGWWRGTPVATASVTVAHGVGLVEFVATMPGARGRGFGAMVTQAAALADPTVPAVLIASDPGRPVYERLGFVAVNRWTLWMRR